MRQVFFALLVVLLVVCTPGTSKLSKSMFEHLGKDLKNMGSKVTTSVNKVSDTVSTTVNKVTTTVGQFQLENLLNMGELLHPTPARCWVCSLLMSTMMEYTVIRKISLDDFIMKDLCKMVGSEAQSICKEFISTNGAPVITALMQSKNPDEACRAINLCDKPQCNLFQPGQGPQVTFSRDWAQNIQNGQSPSNGGLSDSLQTIRSLFKNVADNNLDARPSDAKSADAFTLSSLTSMLSSVDFKRQSPKDWAKGLLNQLANEHTCPFDNDGDKFSASSGELRGYNWRGRDCNDNDAQIYPGRKTNPHSGSADDYNCNGISGVDSQTGSTYEELLCANTNQLGVVVMGDSAGAHAAVPRQWVDAKLWSDYTFGDIIQTLADEADLPHFSAYTGYADTGYTGPVNSVYKYLLERNKCNFRDYQNVAVNGLSSRNAIKSIIRLARDPENDQPLLVFLELVGNDVCNANLDVMTTPEEFRTNILEVLDYIDANVPAGSHLVTLGLVNGSLIYEGVNQRMHPVGVTYNQLYDFQNCLGASMCAGWLNTDKSIRDATTKRAMELNQVYREIFSTYEPKNFDFAYYDFPADEIWAEYAAAGGDLYDLIEPVDGFHPSQIFHAKLGDWLWNTLMTEHADWFGEENPNNDKITKLFGNQGGY